MIIQFFWIIVIIQINLIGSRTSGFPRSPFYARADTEELCHRGSTRAGIFGLRRNLPAKRRIEKAGSVSSWLFLLSD
ncbi:hypothetical protein D3Z50_13280 [Clostridiaceae bacterium]|nr:hypothetical protein [Clostridiaceae bacterium]